MDDMISRKVAVDVMCELMDHWFGADSKDEKREIKMELGKLPSVHPESTIGQLNTNDQSTKMDVIGRRAVIDAVNGMPDCPNGYSDTYDKRHIIAVLEDVPSAQPEIIRCKDCKYWMRAYLSISGKHGCNVMRDYTAPDDYCFKAERKEESMKDLISRQAVLDGLARIAKGKAKSDAQKSLMGRVMFFTEQLPSAQPERTCVNCGRTANNGGWYADGGTRCPIEEHYALPKDGYCHLWEKRNVTDDDYPERRTDG